MKKGLILMSLVLFTLPVMSQGRKYQKGMLKAIKKMDQASDQSGLKECAATFEAFGESHPTEWIPSYYASLAMINAIFKESNEEVEDKLFSSFENDNPLWPSWGAEDVQAELEKLKDIEPL